MFWDDGYGWVYEEDEMKEKDTHIQELEKENKLWKRSTYDLQSSLEDLCRYCDGLYDRMHKATEAIRGEKKEE